MDRLTPLARGLVLVALLVLLPSLAFGSTGGIALGLGLLLATSFATPRRPNTRLSLAAPATLRRREPGTIQVHIDTDAPVACRVDLPPETELARGENVIIAAGPTNASFAIAHGRVGPMRIGPARAHAVDPVGLRAPYVVAESEISEVDVLPTLTRLAPARRAGRPAVVTGDVLAALGPRGGLFSEVRPHQSGDSIRDVNWRATARTSSRDLNLMVNQREPETRRTIWILLDAGPGMNVGTTLERAYDLGAEISAALGMTLGRMGHRVGLLTLRGPPLLIPPESGSRAGLMLARTLAHVDPAEGDAWTALLPRVAGYGLRTRPGFILITRPETWDARGPLDAIRRLVHAAPARMAMLIPAPPSLPAGALLATIQSITALRRRVPAHAVRTVLDLQPLLHRGVLPP